MNQAAEKITLFISDKGFANYASDDLLKSAVERQFEIMGEALNQLSKVDVITVQKVSDYKQIISFRNILIHGYAEIDDRLVWNILETRLPKLIVEISTLLSK